MELWDNLLWESKLIKGNKIVSHVEVSIDLPKKEITTYIYIYRVIEW